MTDEEIKDLAQKIYRGEVFTSYHQGISVRDIPLIFIPLALSNEETRQKMIDDGAHMLYAPMSSAGPRSINGMPQFFEFAYCNEEDAEKVWTKVEAIREAVDRA